MGVGALNRLDVVGVEGNGRPHSAWASPVRREATNRFDPPYISLVGASFRRAERRGGRSLQGAGGVVQRP